MAAFLECVRVAFLRHFPDLSWWLLAVLIACLIAAGISGLGGPIPIGAVLVGCLIVAGVSIVGSAIVALAQAIWDCI